MSKMIKHMDGISNIEQIRHQLEKDNLLNANIQFVQWSKFVLQYIFFYDFNKDKK